MKITLIAHQNLNIHAMVEGYKDGDVLVPVQEFVILKIKPTVEYTCDTILGMVYEIMNDASPRHHSEIMPSFKQRLRSMSVGDVIEVKRDSMSHNQQLDMFYAVEENGFRLLHG